MDRSRANMTLRQRPQIKSVDIYLTYKCNLRCSHCFIGDSLDLPTNFPADSLRQLICTLPSWGVGELTLLGGEPTLYPKIEDYLLQTHELGLRSRIVTNGLGGFSRLIKRINSTYFPHVCFSIDGSSDAVHDATRGVGTFRCMYRNIRQCIDLGYEVAGIMSVTRRNVSDVENVIRLCDGLGFEYLNIHYVTARGYASVRDVISLTEWEDLCNAILAISKQVSLTMRLDNVLVPVEAFKPHCKVENKSSFMFFPDGRVYSCALFFDSRIEPSFFWSVKGGLVGNERPQHEATVCTTEAVCQGCPAAALLNPELANILPVRYKVGCIYQKRRISGGLTTIE